MITMTNNMKLRRQVETNTRRIRALMRDVKADVVRRTENSEDLEDWMKRLSPYIHENIFVNGIHAKAMSGIVKQIVDTANMNFGNTRGVNASLTKGILNEVCYTYVSNVGKDVQTELQRIAVESYNAKNTPRETAELIGQKMDDFSKGRCQVIARTETMRASNLSNHVQAREDGAKSYTVHCNEGACEHCIEEYGENEDTIYDIDDTVNLPPFHPNCRCTPRYSTKTPEERGVDVEDIEETGSMFNGKYETTIENSPSGQEFEVRTYSNGLQLQVAKNSNLSHEEVIAHINSLPEELRRQNNLRRIVIHEIPNKNRGGGYSDILNQVDVWIPKASKAERLDVITHELSHAYDYSENNTTNRTGLSTREVYDKIFKADNDLGMTYVNPETGETMKVDRFPTPYAKRAYEQKKTQYAEDIERWNNRTRDVPKPQDRRYDEDFAESTKLYLNPKTHDRFVKEFPNRAEYLESLYGKPNFKKMYISKVIKKGE